ncbi:vanadium-dependent haloperoxidase [Solirubrobacter sp. CPCC 204708]|uniref:Phosphatase PAP2 family protein n=1 Tax=Solirubrobacter deserti TaxID=2282478 RepID=A0ABT4RMI1_9ACTN|nr:phosphatase PAP2 family protein [Solirubrobacter deserti]MBE2318006.1 vanadium-dependent haloperoxidase [Solirubrobacter deserti]MDA0139685.1 phosphatase PAP2 family protein [Solirubrobacter deserti]
MSCLLGLLVMLVLAHPARADVVNIAPAADCFYSEKQDATDCTGDTLTVGVQGTDAVWNWNAWLQFDVDASLPSGAQIASATLHLHGKSTSDANGVPLAVGPEIGAVQDTVTFADGDAPPAWHRWDVTGAARAATTGNLYLELFPEGGFTLATMRWDFASADVSVPALRPYLEVEYYLPCPSDPFAAAQSSSASTVYAWNNVLLDAFRFDTSPRPPTRLSRAAAMMHIAVFDTLNSVFFAKLEALATGDPDANETCGWKPYQVLAETPATTNADLAAGFAARDVLLALFPNRSTQINASFTSIHGSGPHQSSAQALGQFVAAQVLAARANDGSGASMSYTPDASTPGAWRPTTTASTEAPCTAAVSPGWGNVTPFALTSGSQFRRTLPYGLTTYSALLGSPFYAEQLNEVKAKGRATGSTRTTDETNAAWFWANDLDLTYKPPGQVLQHTYEVAQTQPAAETTGNADTFLYRWSQQGIRVSRLFAEMSIAIADAAIAAWDQKYLTAVDLWRPTDAIHGAGSDGNSATSADANWQPLSADRFGVPFQPCFPAWVSGHATFGGTWARVMENEFRHTVSDDPFPLTLTSEDPHAVWNSHTHRSFDSFAEAGTENALSRIWLGVHYRIDADDGLGTGRAVADQVTATKLRWRQKCEDWTCTTPIS